MLFLEYTRMDHSVHAVADAGVILDEGMALVISKASGDSISVKPSAGVANEVFFGVSMFEKRAPSAFFGQVTLTSDGTADTSAHTIENYVNGSAIRKVNSGNAEANNDNVTVSSTGVIGLTAALSDGDTVTVGYAYKPTINQTIALVGTTIDATPLSEGADVGCGRRGVFYISNFVVADDYKIGSKLELGSTGRFALSKGSGTGVEIPNSAVVHIPSKDLPWLGFELF